MQADAPQAAPTPYHTTADATLYNGDCRDVLAAMPEGWADAIVTDPPYELGFMGKKWDGTGVAFDVKTWAVALRAVKPGGYMLAMGGTRTYHRLACAIEDAGWEIRDCLMWVYGTGFPKGKGCLKPAWEPILLARKPGPRVLPFDVDGCRVPTDDVIHTTRNTALGVMNDDSWKPQPGVFDGHSAGRYPANVLHDGSDEVMVAFAAFGERPTSKPGTMDRGGSNRCSMNAADDGSLNKPRECPAYGDTGTAARFFYCAKASKKERGLDNRHPTVKPLSLMSWMVKLVCPTDSTVLDPFAGSGSTMLAARVEGRKSVGIEKEAAYCDMVVGRLSAATAARDPNPPAATNRKAG